MLAEIDCEFVTKLFQIADIDGCLFLVQELVDGQSLAERIATAQLPTEAETIQIGICISTALRELHQCGIVHRDVKPENILLVNKTPDFAGPILAKLSDLGIARMEEAPDTTAITSAQSMLGTPLYMSPEHFDGGSQVTDQSDIYSLGATLFHALTGQPPYHADTFLALADAHRHAQTPNPQLLNRRISDGLREVVIKPLQKRPDLRYRTATELLDDLLRLQLGVATSINSHPLLPSSASGRMASFSFTWEMRSSPEELWPFVSNTERLNRAIKLPPVAFSIRRNAAGNRQRIGEARIGGMRMQWHALTKRSLDKVYRRIDAVIGSPKHFEAHVDAFEGAIRISSRSARLLDQITDRLATTNLDRVAILKITDYIRSASAVLVLCK